MQNLALLLLADPFRPEWFAILVPICLIILIIVLIPYWTIFKKAGFSPWFALLMILPLVNLITLYVLAFSTWKVKPVREP